jgi:hypothetical protein
MALGWDEMRVFRWRKPATTKDPPPMPSMPPSLDALTGLITSLADASAKRFAAQLEHDSKTEEIQLKKRELELLHAEQIAKADAIDRESRNTERLRKKDWAKENGGLIGKNLGKNRQGQLTDCKVCNDKSDPYLSAADISRHYAGHPGGAVNGS